VIEHMRRVEALFSSDEPEALAGGTQLFEPPVTVIYGALFEPEELPVHPGRI
jgi:hypothetical protein